MLIVLLFTGDDGGREITYDVVCCFGGLYSM
jgi:hypothetical protein